MSKITDIWADWHEDKLIGEGAYGKVYRVYREDLGHRIYSAVKIIELPHNRTEINELTSSGMDKLSITSYYEEMAYLLMDEIKIMESLKTTGNIVVIEDYQLVPRSEGVGWTIYIRMELLKSLSEYLEEHTMTVDDVVKLGIDISEALMACNRVNVIHRDIKIDNIFINTFGKYKLGDFGIAKQLEKTQSALSQKGTGMYMAPEVYRGEKYDSTVDMYSLGIVMYRLLNNGRYPFMPSIEEKIKPGDSQKALSRRINGEKFPYASLADEEMMKMLNKACAYVVDERYHSAEEFNIDLKEYRKRNIDDTLKDNNTNVTKELNNAEEKTESVFSKKGDKPLETSASTNIPEEHTVAAFSHKSNIEQTVSAFSQEISGLEYNKSGIGRNFIIGLLCCVLIGGVVISCFAISNSNHKGEIAKATSTKKTRDTTYIEENTSEIEESETVNEETTSSVYTIELTIDEKIERIKNDKKKLYSYMNEIYFSNYVEKYGENAKAASVAVTFDKNRKNGVIYYHFNDGNILSWGITYGSVIKNEDTYSITNEMTGEITKFKLVKAKSEENVYTFEMDELNEWGQINLDYGDEWDVSKKDVYEWIYNYYEWCSDMINKFK